jgi:hypothetical protein
MRALALVLLLAVPCSAQLSPDLVRARQRALVQLHCAVLPFGEITQSMGFLVRDQHTVLAPAQSARCRTDLFVVTEWGESIQVRSVHIDRETSLALLDLAAPINAEPITLEVAPESKLSVYTFRFAHEGERGRFRSLERRARRPLRGTPGSPVMDDSGRVIGVLDGASFEPEMIGSDRVLAVFDPAIPPISPRRTFSGAVFEGLAVPYEARRPDAPELVGIGFELGGELTIDDTFLIASSTYFFFLNLGRDSYQGWRLQQDLRAGLHLTLSEWSVVSLEGGVAIGYEQRPEWTLGADGNVLWLRPLARASLRIFGVTAAYSCLFDPTQIGSSTHQISFGYTFEFP